MVLGRLNSFSANLGASNSSVSLAGGGGGGNASKAVRKRQ